MTLDTPGSGPTGEPLAEADPRRVGSYTLLRRLGRGGMGVVYYGVNPQGRPVAVKVIRPEVAADQEFRARFRREVANARRVRGFCTAEVIDADPDGEPAYLVTDYVQGPTLARVIREQGPLARADLEQLAVSVATALTVIHSAGVVHRDLKPENVLLSPTGARVIDFGIARALDAATALSREIRRVGTPAFMAPEQVAGAEVTPAADVFAWGGVVIHAGTGRLPFGDGPTDVIFYRIETKAPDLSGLPQPLRDIVAVAMRKDPALRPTAAELYGLLLSASVPAAIELSAAAEAEAEATLRSGPPRVPPIVLTGAGAGTPGSLEALEPLDPRTSVPPRASDPRTPAPPRASDPRVSDLRASDLRTSVPARTSVPPASSTPPAWVAPESRPDLRGPTGSRPAAGRPARRPRRPWRHRGRVLVAAGAALAVAAAVTTFVLLGRDGGPSDEDLATGSRTLAAQAVTIAATDHALSLRLATAAYRLSPTPDARAALLATADTGLATLAVLRGHTDNVIYAAFSPDGKILVTTSDDHTARLWDVTDLAHPVTIATLTGHTDEVNGVAFSPDGKTLATASTDMTARLWDVTDPRRPVALATVTGHTGKVYGVRFSPDGKLLATTGGLDLTARLWDVANPRAPKPVATLTGHTGAVWGLAFSPDGRIFATAATDQKVRLWDVSTPAKPVALATIAGHSDFVLDLAFSPDGRTLATTSGDRTIRLWDVVDPRQPAPLATLTGHTNALYGVAYSPDGKTLATTSRDQTARLWDVADPRAPRPLAVLAGHDDHVYGVAFSPDGRTLATTSADRTVRLWSVDAADLARRACAIPADRLTEAEWKRYLPDLSYRATCA